MRACQLERAAGSPGRLMAEMYAEFSSLGGDLQLQLQSRWDAAQDEYKKSLTDEVVSDSDDIHDTFAKYPLNAEQMEQVAGDLQDLAKGWIDRLDNEAVAPLGAALESDPPERLCSHVYFEYLNKRGGAEVAN